MPLYNFLEVAFLFSNAKISQVLELSERSQNTTSCLSTGNSWRQYKQSTCMGKVSRYCVVMIFAHFIYNCHKICICLLKPQDKINLAGSCTSNTPFCSLYNVIMLSFILKLDLFPGTQGTNFRAILFCSTTPTFFVKEGLRE